MKMSNVNLLTDRDEVMKLVNLDYREIRRLLKK